MIKLSEIEVAIKENYAFALVMANARIDFPPVKDEGIRSIMLRGGEPQDVVIINGGDQYNFNLNDVRLFVIKTITEEPKS